MRAVGGGEPLRPVEALLLVGLLRTTVGPEPSMSEVTFTAARTGR
ncbi:hypothetical protein ACWC9R_09870 [Streptomyces sp. NPDC001219]